MVKIALQQNVVPVFESNLINMCSTKTTCVKEGNKQQPQVCIINQYYYINENQNRHKKDIYKLYFIILLDVSQGISSL